MKIETNTDEMIVVLGVIETLTGCARPVSTKVAAWTALNFHQLSTFYKAELIKHLVHHMASEYITVKHPWYWPGMDILSSAAKDKQVMDEVMKKISEEQASWLRRKLGAKLDEKV